MKANTAIFLVTFMIGTGGSASDWPQYLGPNRNGTSAETGLMRSWPEGGPKVLWTVSVGRGFGGPAIQDGKVYLLDWEDAVGERLRCLDLSSGKELWHFAYDAPGTAICSSSRPRHRTPEWWPMTSARAP